MNWFDLFGITFGVALGAMATYFSERLAERREWNSLFVSSRTHVKSRLMKIRHASETGSERSINNEFHHLGRAMDEYREAIARVPDESTRTANWSTYERLVPVLLDHDLGQIDDLVAELEAA
ncbi:MAG: hypothetical protein ACR2NL_09305 [Acidimicrobiia bacterium]